MELKGDAVYDAPLFTSIFVHQILHTLGFSEKLFTELVIPLNILDIVLCKVLSPVLRGSQLQVYLERLTRIFLLQLLSHPKLVQSSDIHNVCI